MEEEMRLDTLGEQDANPKECTLASAEGKTFRRVEGRLGLDKMHEAHVSSVVNTPPRSR